MRIKSFCMNLGNNRSFLCRLLLLTGWTLGVLLGCLAAKYIPGKDSWMHMLIQSRMSIVGGLAVIFLPLSISAFLVYSKNVVFLIPLAIIKAVMFSFASGCMIRAFGSAGWLMRLLFLFSDSFTTLFCLCFWIRCFRSNFAKVRGIVNTVFCCIAIALLDILVISPFTAIIL